MAAEEQTARRHRAEVRDRARFEFGRNWARFIRFLDDARIREAEAHLTDFLERNSLEGQTFLDVGSGSGLASLAARRLGAAVTSFDYDGDSVACTSELKCRYFSADDRWAIHQGSVLDKAFLARLGKFDVVHAWGVVHHTGAMWQAMENLKCLVKPGGTLFIAVYNDCGAVSRWWLARKRRYQTMPAMLRPIYVLYVWAPIEIRLLLGHLRSRQLGRYLDGVTQYSKGRGMSRMRDIIDWVGGYPYEFATLNEIARFYEADGFFVAKSKENSSYGCHQVVFHRNTNRPEPNTGGGEK
jgi:2-polyprenyl-3-methyl-5-hydroxy-6-metoxy-1,4-benzoquinol methylase